MRILREHDYPDNTARPIAKWRIKDLVQALIQTDVGRNGDVEDCEDEDSDDDGDSDDDPSHEGANESSHEGANERAADNTTALGFLKLLQVDVGTLEEGFDDLAATKYTEGPEGIDTVANSTKSSILPATSFVAGFANAIVSFSASFSKTLVLADPNVKSSVLKAALQPYLFRAPNSNLVQRIRREYEITPLYTCVSLLTPGSRALNLIISIIDIDILHVIKARGFKSTE